jgi:hypothetical protein
MKINDKVIAAFLVSAGLFSSAHAAQYVSELSVKEKKSFSMVVQKANDDEVGAADGCDVPGTGAPQR